MLRHQKLIPSQPKFTLGGVGTLKAAKSSNTNARTIRINVSI